MKTLLQILLLASSFGVLFIVLVGIQEIFDIYGFLAGWLSVAAIIFFAAMYGKVRDAQRSEDELREKLTFVSDALTKTAPK